MSIVLVAVVFVSAADAAIKQLLVGKLSVLPVFAVLSVQRLPTTATTTLWCCTCAVCVSVYVCVSLCLFLWLSAQINAGNRTFQNLTASSTKILLSLILS